MMFQFSWEHFFPEIEVILLKMKSNSNKVRFFLSSAAGTDVCVNLLNGVGGDTMCSALMCLWCQRGRLLPLWVVVNFKLVKM